MKFTRPIFREIAIGEHRARWQAAMTEDGVFVRPLNKRLWSLLTWDTIAACYDAEDAIMDQKPTAAAATEPEPEAEAATEATETQP
jgi:hypothetical protein